jgi:hypothetical protein
MGTLKIPSKHDKIGQLHGFETVKQEEQMKKQTLLMMLNFCGLWLFLFCASLGFSEEKQVLLTFKDGSTQCGAYTVKAAAYCKFMAGGEMCWQKADVKTAAAVDACEDRGGFGIASAQSVESTRKESSGPSAAWLAEDKRAREKNLKELKEYGNKRREFFKTGPRF